MMVEACIAALAEAGNAIRSTVESVRVVKGIWPYENPGRLVADQLGLGNVETVLTQIGGNATYDLINQTALEIAEGRLGATIVCGAETMRTRRHDKAEGRRSTYLSEEDNAAPDCTVGVDVELVDEADIAADVHHPVNFYAMAESAIRHGRGEAPDEHLTRISELWATGSAIASGNPHAWLPNRTSAAAIASPSASNRMVAAPYTKLLTSNINVDQAAAVVLCPYDVAKSAGIDDSNMVFLLSGSGAHDHLRIRHRDRLDQSPAFALSARRALALAETRLSNVELLDLYSCFPASVQLAQNELGIDPSRPFTITGGLTFAGGPFNGYCTQAIAHAAHLLRGTSQTALLYGNGGYFSKHSVLLVSGTPPENNFRYERPQTEVDALPRRTLTDATSPTGTIEAYTVTYNRHNNPQRAILSVLDDKNCRLWAESFSPEDISVLLTNDAVGRTVRLTERPDEHSNGHPASALATLI